MALIKENIDVSQMEHELEKSRDRVKAGVQIHVANKINQGKISLMGLKGSRHFQNNSLKKSNVRKVFKSSQYH